MMSALRTELGLGPLSLTELSRGGKKQAAREQEAPASQKLRAMGFAKGKPILTFKLPCVSDEVVEVPLTGGSPLGRFQGS